MSAMQQELESCWETIWWELRYRTGYGSACLPTEASSYRSLSLLSSPDSWVALASTDGAAAWLSTEFARLSHEVWSREWSQPTTSTYWVQKQLRSFQVVRQGSQAAWKSVWSGCLDGCSRPFRCVCSRLQDFLRWVFPAETEDKPVFVPFMTEIQSSRNLQWYNGSCWFLAGRRGWVSPSYIHLLWSTLKTLKLRSLSRYNTIIAAVMGSKIQWVLLFTTDTFF